jgi:hypothetical protein
LTDADEDGKTEQAEMPAATVRQSRSAIASSSPVSA